MSPMPAETRAELEDAQDAKGGEAAASVEGPVAVGATVVAEVAQVEHAAC
jgi:hypothetical protein